MDQYCQPNLTYNLHFIDPEMYVLKYVGNKMRRFVFRFSCFRTMLKKNDQLQFNVLEKDQKKLHK